MKEKILRIIISYIQEHGYPPTTMEITELAGFKSKNSTHYYLRQMFDEGMLETDCKGSARAIRVPGYVHKKKFIPEDSNRKYENDGTPTYPGGSTN